MASEMTSRKVATGLLAITALALLVGLFNASKVNLTSTKIEEGTQDKSVSSLLVSANHLALIEVAGIIAMDSSNQQGLFESESNAIQARKALDRAAKDDSIKGILLRINSPGGTVGMSQELNAAVQRASAKKPVVASMGDLAASGGYYTACAADKIVANPGTLTGSIGVIISTMNMTGLLNDKLGVKAVTIKSGKYKDILSPYRTPRPDELQLVQTMINDSYADFLNAVITGRTRGITDEAEKAQRIASIKAVADGRVIPGRQALHAGLVDQLGDQDEAYTLLDEMAKERFHMRGKERLPLEKETESSSFLKMLGVEALANKLAPQSQISTADMAQDLLPMSMRYRNQPLWVME